MLTSPCVRSFESQKHKWEENVRIIKCNLLVFSSELEFPGTKDRYWQFGTQPCDSTECERDLTNPHSYISPVSAAEEQSHGLPNI
jgi:hypothetical protein